MRAALRHLDNLIVECKRIMKRDVMSDDLSVCHSDYHCDLDDSIMRTDSDLAFTRRYTNSPPPETMERMFIVSDLTAS